MKRSRLSPPALFLRFFRWFCRPQLRNHIEGDLLELYREEYQDLGKRKADLRFAMEVLRLFRPDIIRSFSHQSHLNPYIMYKSYVKTGWRNLLRNKGYAVINISGLAIGMTIAMLIGLWVADELSFDSYFEKRDQLAEVFILQSDGGESGAGDVYPGSVVAPVIGEEMRLRYASDFKSLTLVSHLDNHVLRTGTDSNPVSASGCWVQRDFPEMFNLEMMAGSRDALKNPSDMLISHSLSKTLFGDNDPMGQTVRVGNRFDLTIGGVYKDLPANTAFANTRLLLPWDNKENWMNTSKDWDNHTCMMFVELPVNASLEGISEKIRTLPTKHITGWKEELMLFPMKRLHLHGEFSAGLSSGSGPMRFVWLFGTIGAFVLILACINFMNLSTARSEKRAKEVGIRKTIGSLRQQLIAQFLTESIVVSFMALVLAVTLAALALPSFNALASKSIVMPWAQPLFWISILGFTLFTGIISGSYPAFYLSSFIPVKVLKGAFRAGRTASLPRKVLVVVQFTVSIILMIGTVVVFQQIQFARDLPAGYSRSGLITVPMTTPEVGRHITSVEADLLHTGVVEQVAESSYSPAYFASNTSVDWPGKDVNETIFIRNINVTPTFGKTIEWKVVQGRDFEIGRVSDSLAVIINEASARVMKLKDPIGTVVGANGKQYTIIGITADMITRSPYERVEPAIFFGDGWLAHFNIRVKPGTPMHEAIDRIGAIFKKYNPGAPFEYQFVDDEYASKFSDEERIGKLAGVFASLAIFISCLGLFGLASFVAEQRNKEIGIRKTMGASVISLWKLLSRDFVVLVTIAFVIAVPVSFMFMNRWLEDYHYHTTLSAMLFISVGIGAMTVALLTVSYQAIRAAMANPVKSLRSE